jgi:hypothetical protein
LTEANNSAQDFKEKCLALHRSPLKTYVAGDNISLEDLPPRLGREWTFYARIEELQRLARLQ